MVVPILSAASTWLQNFEFGEWCVTLHLILVMIPTVQVPLCVVNGILVESYRNVPNKKLR